MVDDIRQDLGTVFIDGYYGYGNAGDEAILASILQQMRRIDPDVTPIVSTHNPDYTARLHNIKQVVSRFKPVDIVPDTDWIQAIYQADHVWIGGGGLFGEAKMLKYAPLITTARLFDTRIATIAVGSGPFLEQTRLAQSLLNHVDAITVRDKQSVEFLRVAGIRDSIEVVADPLFALEPTSVMDSLPKALQENIDENTIAVSVRKPADRDIEIDALATALDLVVNHTGAKITFIPFQVNRRPSDSTVATRITDRMTADAFVWEQELTFRELITAIARAGLVIGMRLHSILFAARVGTPFVGIPYAPKCTSHLEMLEESTAHWCDNLDPGALASDARKRWKEGIPQQTVEATSELESAALDTIPMVLSQSRTTSRFQLPVTAGIVAADASKRLLHRVRG